MILEEVHFINVQEAAVRPREQTRIEGFFPVHQGAFEVECANHAVFGRAKREIDDGNRSKAALWGAVRLAADTFVAQRARCGWVAAVAAGDDDAHPRQ